MDDKDKGKDSEDDDKEEPGGAMGAGSSSKSKGPNLFKENARLERERKRKEDNERVVVNPAQQSGLPVFGNNADYVIVRDWTVGGLFDDEAVDQREHDICGAVVFTHLLQATYNRRRPLNQRRVLSFLDLGEHIKTKTDRKTFEFRNFNLAIRIINSPGLLQGEKVSTPGAKYAQGEGGRTWGHFEQRQDADNTMIYDVLERGPLGIVIKTSALFQRVGEGFCEVWPEAPLTGEYHALLVVAKGTINGQIFLIVKNSWGTAFGNMGYARVTLPDNERYRIFFPIWE